MSKQELIRETALRVGREQVLCEKIINEMFKVMTAELEAHGFVRIVNFGIFDVYDKKPTKKRNPETGETIKVDGKKYPRFLPSKTLRKIVDN